ncbi:MAG: PEGA domain-containing protein [Candidatus Berkelbacteria bacterium]|nr:MAG: PEGA domain-containing protein [Candidatus Berkelbacteria bacterium]QQG51386.1 MAG: PEGA domain-containing protein [Candidatus Berkelbacteria bacterium]
MSRKRRQMLTFLAGALAVASFFILSSIAVVWANGLRFNPETKRFEQTVVVAVESKQEYIGVSLYLNGELIAREVPYQKRGVLPGNYEVLLQKEGFQDWRQRFELSAAEVGLIKDFRLVAVHPKGTIVEDFEMTVEPYFDTGLSLSESGELLDYNALVSRFVTQPTQARRFGPGYIYQIRDEIRLFFPEGPQDYLIYNLAEEMPARIMLRASSWEILIEEGGVVHKLELDKPQI